MPKTMTFSHLIIKQPASALEFQYFYCISQINFCEPRQKRDERLSPLAPPVPGQAYDLRCGNAYVSTSQSFETFLKHNVGNPGLSIEVIYRNRILSSDNN